jgi:hypothetical protein
MSSSFLSLPQELRIQIYELVLLHQQPVGPWSFTSDDLNLGLFRVNKTIHYESTSIFYSKNRFSFTYAYSVKSIARFLARISRVNANNIRHICIAFPEFTYLRSSDVILESEKSIAILDEIQSSCNNLSMITTSPDQSIYVCDPRPNMRKHLDKYNVKVISEALKLVDTRFRAIPGLRRIIIEVDKYFGPNEVIRREMASQGWLIKPAEFVEEDAEWLEVPSDRVVNRSDKPDLGYQSDLSDEIEP